MGQVVIRQCGNGDASVTPRGQQLGDFLLDPVNQCLWHGTDQISLSPKAFAVLAYMAERSGRLITKQELLDAIWPDIHVTEGVLKRAVLEIRKALSDPIEEPRYIQTLHRRGYRLLAAPGNPEAAPDPAPDHSDVIGRTEEILLLDRSYAEAAGSARQIVFIAGEAGLGKTTLVDHWMGGLRARRCGAVTARGRCLQQFGSGEPYLPVFEALDQLGQEMGRRLVDVLRSRAPTWLLHMPALVSLQDRVKIRDEVFGSTRERMLREITDALEVLSEAAPIVLALEDLHWSDPSTIDLLSAIGRRTNGARLMILATYRPSDIRGAGPLFAAQNELELHRQCKVLRLHYFSEQDTRDYMARRFPGGHAPQLGSALHHRTRGNPLYIVCLTDELERTGGIDGNPAAIRDLLPDTLQQMFERQAAQLPAREQELLDAASVAGETFAIAEVAAALGWEPGDVELLCEGLARTHVILKDGESVRFPDGAESAGYAFLHALCRDALYRRLPAGRRARLHGRLAQAQERLYASDPERVAGQLAGHFEIAGDISRTIFYLRKAADGAAARYSSAAAASYLDRAFALVERLPESERSRTRMDVLEQRGVMRLSASDMSGAAADFTALAEEAALAGVPERQVKALLECAVPLVFVDHTRVATVIEAARVALPAAADPSLAALVEIYGACLTMHFHGWTPELAGRVMSAAPALASITDVRTRGRIACLRAGMHCFAGEYAEARQYSEESQRCSRKAGVFFDYFLAVAYLNWAEILSGDLGASVRTTRAAIELAERNETPFPTLWFNVRLAWTQMEAYEFQRPLAMLSVRAADPQVQAVRNNGYFILLWLGMARMATHDYDGAWDAFHKLEKAIEVGGMPFQVRSPLLACQTELAVARREFAEARTLAQRLVIHSEKHHDFAFAARGHRLLADLALMESDADAAAAHIQRAMETLGRCERSLWEWRIHASAARIFARLGRLQESAESRKRARVAADRIANTLADEPELQTSFLRRVAAELETTAASA